jgi:hypothetical protein
MSIKAGEIPKPPELPKPPRGLFPKHLWLEQRKEAVVCAIERRLKAGGKVPIEWISEYNDYSQGGHWWSC